MSDKKIGKVTGIGGVFFKSENPAELKKWYTNNLHFPIDEYGHPFAWRQLEDPKKIGYTQWSVFEKDTEYLKPAKKDFMINFRVENIEALIEEMKENGLQVVGKMEEYEYGKFAWVMDPEGNKIELWEPVDEVFTKWLEEKNNKK
jgi:predicted enzyme related to lactoylglutathione lyase